MTKETNIVAECRLAASECGVIVWRNNVGALPDSNGRIVRYGLCVGSSDLIGIQSESGRFVALEAKVPNWKPSGVKQKKHWDEQLNFIAQVIKNGGIAGVVRCKQDVYDLLKNSVDKGKKKVL